MLKFRYFYVESFRSLSYKGPFFIINKYLYTWYRTVRYRSFAISKIVIRYRTGTVPYRTAESFGINETVRYQGYVTVPYSTVKVNFLGKNKIYIRMIFEILRLTLPDGIRPFLMNSLHRSTTIMMKISFYSKIKI